MRIGKFLEDVSSIGAAAVASLFSISFCCNPKDLVIVSHSGKNILGKLLSSTFRLQNVNCLSTT